MRALARSFFARNLLLLMTLFAFGLGCGTLALREWAQKPRITEIAELVARQMRLAQLNFEVVPEEHRASMRPWLNSRSSIQIRPTASIDPPVQARPSPAARQFVFDLKFRLPEARGVLWTPNDRGTVWVQMQVGKSTYWLIESGVYLETSVSATGIGLLVLVALLSVFGTIRIQRSLARADAERAVLLAGVSHDLRTPIAKMRLAIEMLGENSDADLVRSMLQSVREMSAATEQFLYYARDQDKRDFVATELNSLALESIQRHRRESRSIILHSSVDCSVLVHPESIGRALDNLIENALRYSKADVEVAVQAGRNNGRVSVLDRGPGIPPSEVEALKRPFARGTAGIGTAGTGLGLAIVERIASSHGARFELLPREGGGTEARLVLPKSPASRG